MCALDNVVAVGADFTGSTLNYANLAGADFSNAILNETALHSVAFLDNKIISKHCYNPEDVSAAINTDKLQDIVEKFNSFRNISVSGNIKSAIIDKLSRNSSDPLKKKTMEKKDVDPSELMQEIAVDIRKCMETYRRDAATRCLEPICMQWVEKRYADDRPNFNFMPAKLMNASLKSAALPNSNFSYVDISGASFDDSDINESEFNYNTAVGARFSNANVSNSYAYRSDFRNSAFVFANGVGTEFLDCNLSNTSFEKALLINAKFMNSDRDVMFIQELIKKSFMDGKQLEDTEFNAPETIRDIWRRSVYAYADMQDCNFQKCIASDSVFVGMNFDRTIFTSADLKKAFFANCVARWADLSKVNLSYALLLGIVFDHTALSNVIMSNSRMFATFFSECNLSGSNMISCRFDNIVFDNCDLNNANLSNSVFYNCTFRNINMYRANISKTMFVNCRFESCGIDEAINPCLSVHENSRIEDEKTKQFFLKNPTFFMRVEGNSDLFQTT